MTPLWPRPCVPPTDHWDEGEEVAALLTSQDLHPGQGLMLSPPRLSKRNLSIHMAISCQATLQGHAQSPLTPALISPHCPEASVPPTSLVTPEGKMWVPKGQPRA